MVLVTAVSPRARLAAVVAALALAALGLATLMDDEAPPPRRPTRIAVIGDAPTAREAAALPAAADAPAPGLDAEAAAPTPDAPVEHPLDAPAIGARAIQQLLLQLRAGRGAAGRRAPGDGPALRGPGLPGAPTAWVPGPHGLVPIYGPDERALLDAEADRVRTRRGTIVGTLTDVGPDGLAGFAYDQDDPAAVLTVDLFVDGFAVASVRADASRPGGHGARRGFRAAAPAALFDGERHVVQALARRPDDTTGVELVGSPRRVGGNQVPDGALVHLDAEAVVGWARDPDGGPPAVHVRFDGRPLAPVAADGPRPVGLDGPATGWFRVALPPHDPARPHQVQVLVEDAQVAGLLKEVRGSPRALAEPENRLPRGAIAFVTPTQISGWALDPDVGDAPIAVDVHFDGAFWRRLVADQEFAALVHQPGITSPYHLWVVDVPPELQDGRTHTISVFAVNQPEGPNPELAGSPATFRSATNTPPAGWVDVANHDLIAGWAYDADLGAGPVEVEVWIDGALWTVVRADQRRPDLVPVVCPEPDHGWSVPAPEALRDGGFHTVRVLARNHPGGPAQELSGSPRELGGLRPWLGVGVAGAPPRGLRVTQVAPGSPASEVDLRVGDLLLAMNGAPAPVDPEPFARWVQARTPGEAVSLELERHEPVAAPRDDELTPEAREALARASAPDATDPTTATLPDGRVGRFVPEGGAARQEWTAPTRRTVHPVLVPRAGV